MLMHRLLFLALGFLFVTSSVEDRALNDELLKGNKKLKNTTFHSGESLSYKASVGFINAAEATFQIDPELYTINGRKSYKIDIYAKTIGLFDVLQRVRDNWGSYMDSADMVPHQSYRYIEEGRYRKNEIVHFDQQNRKAVVHKLEKETRKLKETVDFDVPENVQDLVSGYYYFRLLDFSEYHSGDTIAIRGFFDDELYNLNIIYEGKEKVSTSVGDFNALVFYPVMEKNKIFRSDNPVKLWVSDDRNHIPLKIKANMVVGSLNVDIKGYQNVRYPLNFSN
jgi:hypothetical protein